MDNSKPFLPSDRVELKETRHLGIPMSVINEYQGVHTVSDCDSLFSVSGVETIWYVSFKDDLGGYILADYFKKVTTMDMQQFKKGDKVVFNLKYKELRPTGAFIDEEFTIRDLLRSESGVVFVVFEENLMSVNTCYLQHITTAPDPIEPVRSWMNKLADDIHAANAKRGWFEDEKNIGEMLCLIHSEVSEALEADRKNKYAIVSPKELIASNIPELGWQARYEDTFKHTFEEEMADIIIRTLDMCAFKNIDIYTHIQAKLRYNELVGKNGKRY